MVPNSLKSVSWKNYKAITTEEETLLELERFAEKWDNQNTLFNYPEAIRKAI